MTFLERDYRSRCVIGNIGGIYFRLEGIHDRQEGRVLRRHGIDDTVAHALTQKGRRLLQRNFAVIDSRRKSNLGGDVFLHDAEHFGKECMARE